MSALSIARPDVDFLITNGCPNRCQHCVFASGERLPEEMDTREVIAALRRIKDGFGVRAISLSGGEPFSRPDFPAIYREASRLFKVTLISSGMGAGDAVRQALAEAPPAQAISSLYGLDSEHDAFCRKEGAFAALLRHLEFLGGLRKTAGFPLAANIVCHRGNAGAVSEMLEYLASRGLVDEVKLLALSPVGRGRGLLESCMSGREWIDFSERVRSFVARRGLRFKGGVRIERHVVPAGGAEPPGCHVVRDQGGVFSSCVHVDADGAVYPCTLLVRREEFRLGSVRGPGEFSLESYHGRVRHAWAGIQEGCRGRCQLAGSCSGGCLGYHLSTGWDYRCAGEGLVFGCPDRYEVLVPGIV